MSSLTERQQAILDFERERYQYQGAKEEVIRSRFGNVTHYYMELNQLLDEREAIEYAPVLTARLRARRTTRLRVRKASHAW